MTDVVNDKPRREDQGMVQRSRYDELHDFYEKIGTTKSGTRYERLAAVVFAALDRTSIVIHDLKVVGSDTGVKHQIDVQIEKNDQTRRILVECKDFDVSGDSVGLGIIRDFWGVVDDVHPDEAWVITCNGFTDDARRYAKGKRIKLATLRDFAQADWQNRVQTITGTITIEHVHRDRPDLRINMDDVDAAKFQNDMAQAYPKGYFEPDEDRTQLFDGKSIRSLSEVSMQLGSTKEAGTDETQLVESGTAGWVSADGNARYSFKAYSLGLPITRSTQSVTISGVLDAAKLLLTDDSGLDFVLWDTTLEAYTIEEDGSVTLAPEAVQKRLLTSVSAIRIH